MLRFLKSIRWTLQLWHAGILAVALAGFGTASYYGISRARYEQVDADLERSVQLLGAGTRVTPPWARGGGGGGGGLGAPPGETRPPWMRGEDRRPEDRRPED